VTIPSILCETNQAMPRDQIQSGNVNVMFTSQEPESDELVHQHSFLPTHPSFMGDDHLDSQAEDTTREEFNTTDNETSWASDNEEYKCDIKYEMQSDLDLAIDPLQLEMEHLDLPQQNNFTRQISTKSESHDLSGVNGCSDTQQTTMTSTEDPLGAKNFICGTCGARFWSYNQLKIHDRVHLKRESVDSRVKNIRRRKGTAKKKVRPSLRPKKCEECGKILSTHKTWTHHIMTFHRGQYKFKCTLCDYGCQNVTVLRTHIKRHSLHKGDFFNCSKCDKGFMSKQARSLHMLTCSVLYSAVQQ